MEDGKERGLLSLESLMASWKAGYQVWT